MANTEIVLRLWFIRGFGDARLGRVQSSFDAEGDLEKVQAWEAGSAHFHNLVRSEDDRLSAMLRGKPGDDFPNWPGKPAPCCDTDGNNLPMGEFSVVVKELERRGGTLKASARQVEGECRCQVLGDQVRIYKSSDGQTLGVVLF
jgi:hypothetical protein